METAFPSPNSRIRKSKFPWVPSFLIFSSFTGESGKKGNTVGEGRQGKGREMRAECGQLPWKPSAQGIKGNCSHTAASGRVLAPVPA